MADQYDSHRAATPYRLWRLQHPSQRTPAPLSAIAAWQPPKTRQLRGAVVKVWHSYRERCLSSTLFKWHAASMQPTDRPCPGAGSSYSTFKTVIESEIVRFPLGQAEQWWNGLQLNIAYADLPCVERERIDQEWDTLCDIRRWGHAQLIALRQQWVFHPDSERSLILMSDMYRAQCVDRGRLSFQTILHSRRCAHIYEQ